MSRSSAPKPECIACACKDRTTVFDEFGIAIFRCDQCKHMYSSYLSGQNYDGYFDREIADEERFWWDTAHRRMFRDFGSRFLSGRGGTLLDVGAGLGYFVKFAQAYGGWEVYGYEISASAVDYARDTLGLNNMFVGRVEESGFPDGSLDLITLWDVLEHIPDPKDFLSYLRSKLKPEGRLFVATPNAPAQLLKARAKKALIGMREGSHYLEAKDHMNIYNVESLTQTLSRANFRDVKFVHLPPIQSVSGSSSRLALTAKNAWFRGAQALGVLTRNHINVNNNLYAITSKN